ncbi:hypothetical protein BH09PLA1_BH09PLA1_26710 [soil metagenome]
MIVPLVCALSIFAPAAIAQVSISLPSSGVYQPGQFMWVIVSAQGAARDGTIILLAPGALPTVLAMRGQSHATVPLLLLTSEAQQMSWSLDGSPPRPVDAPLVAQLRDVSPSPREAERVIVGPNSSIEGADVYSPVLGWEPGASARVRRMSILGATLIAIALLACPLLLRGRATLIAIFVLVAISATGIAIGRRYLSPIWRAEGEVVIVGADGAAQFDTWQYIATRSPAESSIELPAGARPVFVDPQHARDTHASLHFDAAKNILSLRFKLQPKVKLAVLLRRVTASASPPPWTRASTQPTARAMRSPIVELARRSYVTRETRIVDEGSVQWIDDQLIHWPSVILWREGR